MKTPRDWPFADPPNVAVITVRQIVDGSRPVLLVTRDADDGAWQFLTGGAVDEADATVVSLRSMIDRDPTLARLADLPPGTRAWRAGPESPWSRHAASD